MAQSHTLAVMSAFTMSLHVACGSPEPTETGSEDSARFPDDWTADPSDATDTEPDAVEHLTLQTSAGLYTIPAVDEAGAPVTLHGAFAFDTDGDGAEELYVSSGPLRYRLDLSSLTLVDPIQWTVDGEPVEPDLFTAGRVQSVDLATASIGSTLYAIDVANAALVAPYTMFTDVAGAPAPFEPDGLTILRIFSEDDGILVAVKDDVLFVDLSNILLFQLYLAPLETCYDATPLSSVTLSATALDGVASPMLDVLSVVDDAGRSHALEELRCFDDGTQLTDDAGVSLTPLFQVGADVDGDGWDDLIWGHR